MVTLQSAFTLPVPVEAAFDLLVDPAAIAASIPGARPSAPGAPDGELDLDAGFATVTLRGAFEPGVHDREAATVSFRAAGTEVAGDAPVHATGVLRLSETDGATAVAVELEVEAEGRLAAGGVSGMRTTMRRLVEALAAGLRERTAEAVIPAPADVDARAELALEEAEAVGYGWMVAATGAAAAAAREPAPNATATPLRVAPAATSPSGDPQAPRAPRKVPGRVEVVTRGPLPAAGIPVGDGPLARFRALHRNRPWLVPAVLLGLIALAILLRRRSD